ARGPPMECRSLAGARGLRPVRVLTRAPGGASAPAWSSGVSDGAERAAPSTGRPEGTPSPPTLPTRIGWAPGEAASPPRSLCDALRNPGRFPPQAPIVTRAGRSSGAGAAAQRALHRAERTADARPQALDHRDADHHDQGEHHGILDGRRAILTD